MHDQSVATRSPRDRIESALREVTCLARDAAIADHRSFELIAGEAIGLRIALDMLDGRR